MGTRKLQLRQKVGLSLLLAAGLAVTYSLAGDNPRYRADHGGFTLVPAVDSEHDAPAGGTANPKGLPESEEERHPNILVASDFRRVFFGEDMDYQDTDFYEVLSRLRQTPDPDSTFSASPRVWHSSSSFRSNAGETSVAITGQPTQDTAVQSYAPGSKPVPLAVTQVGIAAYSPYVKALLSQGLIKEEDGVLWADPLELIRAASTYSTWRDVDPDADLKGNAELRMGPPLQDYGSFLFTQLVGMELTEGEPPTSLYESNVLAGEVGQALRDTVILDSQGVDAAEDFFNGSGEAGALQVMSEAHFYGVGNAQPYYGDFLPHPQFIYFRQSPLQEFNLYYLQDYGQTALDKEPVLTAIEFALPRAGFRTVDGDVPVGPERDDEFNRYGSYSPEVIDSIPAMDESFVDTWREQVTRGLENKN